MKARYAPLFIQKLKKANVRIRNAFKQKIAVFQSNPSAQELNNHPLKGDYHGIRSINITSDWRALYEIVNGDGNELSAYFVDIGSHEELYG